jgi:hypothetical protein
MKESYLRDDAGLSYSLADTAVPAVLDSKLLGLNKLPQNNSGEVVAQSSK